MISKTPNEAIGPVGFRRRECTTCAAHFIKRLGGITAISQRGFKRALPLREQRQLASPRCPGDPPGQIANPLLYACSMRPTSEKRGWERDPNSWSTSNKRGWDHIPSATHATERQAAFYGTRGVPFMVSGSGHPIGITRPGILTPVVAFQCRQSVGCPELARRGAIARRSTHGLVESHCDRHIPRYERG